MRRGHTPRDSVRGSPWQARRHSGACHAVRGPMPRARFHQVAEGFTYVAAGASENPQKEPKDDEQTRIVSTVQIKLKI